MGCVCWYEVTHSLLSVDETTNKLFEAQVAVMGFKCRVMQLKGELDDLRKEGSADASARNEIERLTAENITLREDISQAKRERDEARRLQQTVPPSSSNREKVCLYQCVHVHVHVCWHVVANTVLAIKPIWIVQS